MLTFIKVGGFLKKVILSADSNRYLYSVPDKVADNLENYCQYFANEWMINSLDRKMIVKKRNHFDQTHFILYLNRFLFPNEQAYLIKDLGWIDYETPMPKEYAGIPFFNF